MSSTDPQAPLSSIPSLLRRTLRRRWWPILTRWALLTVALMCAIYVMPPTGPFRSRVLLRADPPTSNGCPSYPDPSLDEFLQAQVPLITSPDVLAAAAANPKVVALPGIKGSGDAVQELREIVRAEIIPNTYLLEVSVILNDPGEAATIVNAVVDAFMQAYTDASESMTRAQIKNLEPYNADLKNQSDQLERKWKNYAKHYPDVPIKIDVKDLPRHARAMIEEYRSIYKQLHEVKIELAQAEAWLTTARAAIAKAGEVNAENEQALIDEQVKRRFELDPEVIALKTRMFEARTKLDQAKQVSLQAGDPASKEAKRKLDELMTKWRALWSDRSLVIREHIELGGGGKSFDPEQEVREAKDAVDKLLAKQASLKWKGDWLELDIMKVSEKYATDAVEIALIQDYRAALREMQIDVVRRLEQLRPEAKDVARIRPVSPPKTWLPTRPIHDRRPIYLAIIPFATFALVLSFFAGVEAWWGAKPRALAFESWSEF